MMDLDDLLNQPYERGRAMMAMKRYEAAICEFSERLAEWPEDAYLMLLIGQCQYELGRLSDAEASIRQSVSTEPKDPFAHHTLGMVLLIRGKNIEEAKQCFDAALALAPEEALPHLGLARYHVVTDDYRTAETYVDRSLAINPTLLKALQLKAMLLAWRGEVEQANRVVEQALRQEPENAETFQIAAYTSDLKGDLRAAVGFQEESLRIAPGREQAQRVLQAKAKAATGTNTSLRGSWLTMGIGLLALVPVSALASKISALWFDWLLIVLCGVVVVKTLLPVVYVSIASKRSFGKVMLFENWHQARNLVHTTGALTCYSVYVYTRVDFYFSAAAFLFVYGLVGLIAQVMPQRWLRRTGFGFLGLAYLLGGVNCVLNFTAAGSSRLISQALFVGVIVFFVLLGLMLPSNKKNEGADY
ncbi:tetratricopeptide repeat protein [Neolewinella aurantiaca]|uniref:Tetratricopeptide repeat protein n=1 Tax=Neolewinella aurantiaca TaxID=2602767 RepID=A0A5C7FYD6_9BACT|nr:tetratricopeptide repeat protein [Neolewinella aurantiaca]TXF90641.1 tetratricopeptide repeat protein [Neolewinella aurantiaca]